MVFRPTTRSGGNREPNLSTLGKLERVGKQILEHLLQALGVCNQTAGEVWITEHIKDQLAILGLVTEWTSHHIKQIGEEYLLGFHRDGSGFDLGEIKDVADQVQEIRARAVNGASELNLLRRQIAVRILGKLLTKYKNTVERC